jgi:hypothetical protein
MYVIALTASQYQFPPISLAEPAAQACAVAPEMAAAMTAPAVIVYFMFLFGTCRKWVSIELVVGNLMSCWKRVGDRQVFVSVLRCTDLCNDNDLIY